MKRNPGLLLSDDCGNRPAVGLDVEFELDDDCLEALDLSADGRGGSGGREGDSRIIRGGNMFGGTKLVDEDRGDGNRIARSSDTHVVDLETSEDQRKSRSTWITKGRHQKEALDERAVAFAQGALEVVAEAAKETLQSLLKERRASIKETVGKDTTDIDSVELSSPSQRRRMGGATRMTPVSARVGGELVALFAGNMIDAVISAAELEGESSADKEHLEQALPQLLLDF